MGVCGNVCCVAAVVKNSFFNLGVLKYVVCLCRGCDGCCAVDIYLALWYVVLVCHQYYVCENSVGSVYVGGYGGPSETGLCVFCKLCPVCFLVVGKGPSVLL